MLVSRLVPMLVFGAVAAHSGGAAKERLAKLTGASEKMVTKQRMVAILDAALLHTVAGDELKLNDPKELARFIRKAIRIKGDSKADPSKDFWGTPYKATLNYQGLTLTSAGPDKAFGTKDDLVASQNIYDY